MVCRVALGAFALGALMSPAWGRCEEIPADAAEMIQAYELESTQLTRRYEQDQRRQLEKLVADLAAARDKHAKPGEIEQAFAVQQAINRYKYKLHDVRPAPRTVAELDAEIGTSRLLLVTGATAGQVWGTGVYTADSDLSAAVVHAGVVRPGESKPVRVTVLEGRDGYEGSDRNGVTTNDWESFERSFRVEPAEVK